LIESISLTPAVSQPALLHCPKLSQEIDDSQANNDRLLKRCVMPAQLSSWLNAATAIALAVAVGVIVKGRTETPAPATAVVTDDSQQARLGRLERELAALGTMPRSSESHQVDLEARLDALKREMAKLSGKPNATTAPAAAVPADPIEQERQEHEFKQQAIATLENSLANEPMDANASMVTSAELSRVMQSPVFEKTRIGEVQCRSTLCRIDVSHADPQAEMQFSLSLSQVETFREGEGFVQMLPRSDGGIDTVVYVSRTGHHLPVPPRS
jgi:hypothetical protein